jgi:hypothetical protein
MSEQDNLEQETPAEDVAIAVPDKFKGEDGNVNQDALLKSYTELEKERSRTVNRINELEEKAQMSEALLKQGQALEKIVENTTQKEDAQPTYNDYLKEKALELGLDEDDPSLKLLADFAAASESWRQQDIEKLTKDRDADIAKFKEEYANDKRGAVRSTPEYVQNEAKIKALTDNGMPEENAIKFVLEQVRTQSDVSEIPASTPVGGVRETPVKSSYWSSAEEREESVRTRGPEVTARMEKEGERRMAIAAREAAEDRM